MKHLIFFFLTISVLIGPLSLALLILAYLRTKSKFWLYIFLFLLSETIVLFLISLVIYRCTNITYWYPILWSVALRFFDSLIIITLPLAGNEIFQVPRKRLINMLFGTLWVIFVPFIIISHLIGMIKYNTAFESLPIFKIYVIIIILPVAYVLLLLIRYLRNVSDLKDRKLLIYSAIALFIAESQIVMPVFQTFPQDILVYPTIYFLWNLYFIKYTVDKAFFNAPLLIQSMPASTVIGILPITEREKEIVHLIFRGKTYKEVGAELFISEDTVKTHIKNIYRKLGVRNKLQLLNLINEKNGLTVSRDASKEVL